MYETLRELTLEAKAAGLIVVVWSYPRGSGISKDGEQSLDVVSYGAHIAAQLGAHIVKVKLPKDRIEQPEAGKVYDAHKPAQKTLTDRVRHVVQCTFAGKRIVIFSGGEAKDDAALLDEIRAIRDGGGYGSIIGRNSFQRPFASGVKLLQDIMDIYQG
jgi:class I fructose-bisphosphate aldolase